MTTFCLLMKLSKFCGQLWSLLKTYCAWMFKIREVKVERLSLRIISDYERQSSKWSVAPVLCPLVYRYIYRINYNYPTRRRLDLTHIYVSHMYVSQLQRNRCVSDWLILSLFTLFSFMVLHNRYLWTNTKKKPRLKIKKIFI